MSEVTEVIGEVPPEACIQKDELQAGFYFPTPIYTGEKPEWLNTLGNVGREYLELKKKSQSKLDKLYPVYMTDTFHTDERVREMVQYIANTGWDILNSQGYAMNEYNVVVHDFWLQDHHMHSANEEHIHPFGVQLTGFYFLECPPDCSRVIIHDPRPGKKQINLPEKDMSQVTLGSIAINFEPKPGMLMIAPAWLPHAFGRHGSKKPFRFIHFNLGIMWKGPMQANPDFKMDTAEVV